MKVSREQMAKNRDRILEEAGRLFREKGFEAVSVAEVMKAAGLTHGGFYGHFASKDDLIAQTLTHGLAPDAGGSADARAGSADSLRSFLDGYLSCDHRDNAAAGCLTAALAGDVRRQDPAARAALAQGFRAQIDRMSDGLQAFAPDLHPDERRQAAIGNWAAMVGAVMLARVVDDPDFSEEILASTRSWIDRGLELDREAISKASDQAPGA